MSEPSPEDVAWAARAYHSGRGIEFIASVLGMPPKKAFALVRAQNGVRPPRNTVSAPRQEAEVAFARVTSSKPGPKPYESKLAQYRMTDEEGEFIDRPQTPFDAAARAESVRASERRRRRLRRFFARHWDMIWFLRRQNMSGRQIRRIYGAECLIWSVGGGIDPDCS